MEIDRRLAAAKDQRTRKPGKSTR